MRSIVTPKPEALLNILAARPDHHLDPAGNDSFPSAQDMPRVLERTRLQALVSMRPEALAVLVLDLNERADDLEHALAVVYREGLPVNEG